MTEAKVDERVQAFLDYEDEDIIWDLRTHNAGRPEKYTVFLEHSKRYPNNQGGIAADEWRHDTLVHMATACQSQYFSGMPVRCAHQEHQFPQLSG